MTPTPKPTKIVPIYLVLLEDPTVQGKSCKFLAVRLEIVGATLQLVGIDTVASWDAVSASYNDILAHTEKTAFKEIVVPLNRVIRVQNLIYHYK